MIWGILLYYIWVVLCLYLSYVLLFGAYEDEELTKRFKFPFFVHICAFISAFIPVLNVLATIGIIVWMFYLYSEEDIYFKSFLLKKI